MSRVTSKLQVTVPRAVAVRHGIRPGCELEWLSAGDSIRVKVQGTISFRAVDAATRLEIFDAATARQRRRDRGARPRPTPRPGGRGWTREELYTRGRAR